MDLRSGQAFWPLHDGTPTPHPPLTSDLRCEVLVLGAGITGALVADRLSESGAGVAVLDRRDAARGSTSASTGLLQYEIDTPLHRLKTLVGKEHAERAYRLCLDAIDGIERLTDELGDDCGFRRLPSLYYASDEGAVEELECEWAARRALGIEVELWRRSEIESRYGFGAPAALYSRDGGQIDPYRLTHRLLARAEDRGAAVFGGTEAVEIRRRGEGFAVATATGCEVACDRLVFATGYESQAYLKEPVAKLHSSYAIVSEPLDSFAGWHEQSLIWETARPYLYLRTTEDGRALVGGEDEPFRDPDARDRLLARKSRILAGKARRLLPDLDLRTAFAWTGTFGETEDGLAYIGESDEYPGAWFALGYGGNGITFSLIAADIVRDLHLGRDNPDRHIFRFGR